MTVSLSADTTEAPALTQDAAGVPLAQANVIIRHPVTAAPAAPQPVPQPVQATPMPIASVIAGPAPIVMSPLPAPTPAAPLAGGVDAMDFVRANRIHVKDGSLFVDPYLVLHPRELDPAQDAALRKKLQLTYSINNPSFFESRGRMAISLNLGQLIPISTESKRSQLMEEIDKFNKEVQTGKDADLEGELDRKAAPFASIVKHVTDRPERDPVGMELLKNSLSMYLLVREKMTQQGYLGKLTDYVQRAGNAEQVTADLSIRTGVTPLAMREAALHGGLDGVGQLLGLDPKYVSEAKALAEYASTQDFSYNIVEHWHLGRQLQGLDAPMAEKLAVGMDQRITAKIGEYRNKVHHHYDVPEPVKKEQNEIAQALNLVEPVQRALMFKLGYELCYTREVNADAIAYYKGVYGLHRKAANDMRDTQGTYRIYFSGHGDLKGSMRTLTHEITHNLWPEHFAADEVPKIDALAKSDQQRFALLQHMMDNHYTEFETLFNNYKTAGDDSQRQAIVQTANKHFAPYGFDMQGLFPYLRDAHDFKFVVKHAYDTLNIEGERYNRSSYNSPEERFREVISRFAELKQVEYRGDPQFLQFLAPGLNQIYENHYLPHLAKVYQGIVNGEIPLTHKPSVVADIIHGSVETTPKVEQRPGTPVAALVPVVAAAFTPDSTPVLAKNNVPNLTIETDGIEMNGQVMHAQNALANLPSRMH